MGDPKRINTVCSEYDPSKANSLMANCTLYQCIKCPQENIPNPQIEEYLLLDSGSAIATMAFSSIGILVTLFVIGVFIKYNDTPVVKSAARELSYVMLTGILMCYNITYVLILKPSDIVCGLQRFGSGFGLTVMYAALLTKENLISRVFNVKKYCGKRPNFISARSQLVTCIGLVGIQVLITGIWMISSPPRALHYYPTGEDPILVCSSYIDDSYIISFIYPIFLIVICIVYVVLTRKIPEVFSESKAIGFILYNTCVIWLAFVPLHFGTANHVALRTTSISVIINLSATVTLTCLFSRKLYIVLIIPGQNIRQSMFPLVAVTAPDRGDKPGIKKIPREKAPDEIMVK